MKKIYLLCLTMSFFGCRSVVLKKEKLSLCNEKILLAAKKASTTIDFLYIRCQPETVGYFTNDIFISTAVARNEKFAQEQVTKEFIEKYMPNAFKMISAYYKDAMNHFSGYRLLITLSNKLKQGRYLLNSHLINEKKSTFNYIQYRKGLKLWLSKIIEEAEVLASDYVKRKKL